VCGMIQESGFRVGEYQGSWVARRLGVWGKSNRAFLTEMVWFPAAEVRAEAVLAFDRWGCLCQ
jgi:hypothetical protein